MHWNSCRTFSPVTEKSLLDLLLFFTSQVHQSGTFREDFNKRWIKQDRHMPKLQLCLNSATQEIDTEEKMACLILDPSMASSRNKTVLANTVEIITRGLCFSLYHHRSVSLSYPSRYIHKCNGNLLWVRRHSKVLLLNPTSVGSSSNTQRRNIQYR